LLTKKREYGHNFGYVKMTIVHAFQRPQ